MPLADDHLTQMTPGTSGLDLRGLIPDDSLTGRKWPWDLLPSPETTVPLEGTWTPLSQGPPGPKQMADLHSILLSQYRGEGVVVPQPHPACQAPKQPPKGSASSRGSSRLFQGGSPTAFGPRCSELPEKMQDRWQTLNFR